MNNWRAPLTIVNLTLPIPVLILEDDAVMQQRLKLILLELGYTQEVLIFANTLKEALSLLEEQPISFALVDLGLPDGNGKDFIETLRQQDPTSLILVISAWSTQDAILGAIQAGATGYVLKERDDFEVMLSIRSLLRGGAPIDPFIAQQILSKVIKNSEKPNHITSENNILSARELEILHLVAQGLSNKEIAEKIYLSRYTVECHIKHIYRKLSVSSRAKAVNTARNMGLLP
ncbi:response regulator transcription factor [Acinetobacter venetianus]|uniref:response regulator transcription factor n=1 Tax=Acinetobacter venetianus TaxID=52133 RepID=UPI0007786214|nr:response regulator transcription factor [Acinetobacter venetianus]